MNVRLSILSIALVTSLSGCAALNPMNWFGSSSTAEKPAQLVNFKPVVNFKTNWQSSVGASKDIAFAPAIVLDTVYTANASGQLTKLSALTGKTEWQVAAGVPLSAGVGASIDSEYVGTAKGQVIAFDEAGKKRWATQLSSTVLGVPKAAEGTVVVRTEDGHIYALNAEDGKQKWMYQRVLPALILRSQASLLITKGAIFAGYPGGKLVALSLDTGNVGWEVNVAQPRGASEIERVSDVTSMPVIDEKQVCAAAYQGRVACFEIRTGNLIWAKDISSTAGLTMDDNNLYVSDDKGAVVALDKTRGASVWKQDQLRGRRLSTPRRIGDYLAVGDLEGYIHLLALDDGHFVGRTATDGSAIISQPQERNNSLIVQTAKGGVYSLTAQ
ncbi:outer membrane protein assembly factor BamB [Sulfuriferula thiophila]|uniref:outer membrane protein assembly factor BamB n=1 Tax=Sulfuriferula thiophila TaxID=1781211 RepID=UPI000F6157CE|nr:outer membrane protein assembly factor BamB [Sulfuriferula thiophila]